MVYNTLGVKRCVRALGWDEEEWQTLNHSHGFAQTKQQVG
jgi:hypothetical protein